MIHQRTCDVSYQVPSIIFSNPQFTFVDYCPDEVIGYGTFCQSKVKLHDILWSVLDIHQTSAKLEQGLEWIMSGTESEGCMEGRDNATSS